MRRAGRVSLLTMRITCLHNPISGRGRGAATAARLAAELERSGHEVRSLTTRPPGDAKAALLESDLAETELLVVLGGDGAVRAAAPAAAAAGVPIYHWPSGTENLFAKAFGMDRAAETLRSAIEVWAPRWIDTGRVVVDGVSDGFNIMASLGFDAAVVHDLAAHRSGAISHWSYAVPLLRQLRGWRAPHLRIEVDGRPLFVGRGLLVISNLPEYARGLNPARWADPCDGALDVLAFPVRGGAGAVAWAAEIATGLHLADRRVAHRVGRRIVAESRDGFAVQLDGDPVGTGTTRCVAVEAIPASLEVLAPPTD